MDNDFPSHLQIVRRSITLFANDGRFDPAELDQLLGMAERDGELDADEKRVLADIFRQIESGHGDDALMARIAAIRDKHAIPVLPE